jgi:DNA-binding GntR family transcriptional regulator
MESTRSPDAVEMSDWKTSNESTAERIANVLRRQITEGDLPPGAQLSEERLVGRLGVSRNTLREAFRLLTHDHLLVHRHNRGVFVPELEEGDLVDLYRLRRIVECDVVRSLTELNTTRLRPLRNEVEAAESAASLGEWAEVATANMRFHEVLVRLSDSRRINEITRRLLAELRLAFHVVADPEVLHEHYIRRNSALLDLLEAGKFALAADELERYFRDSEEELLEAYRARRRIGSGTYANTSTSGVKP